MLNCKEKEDFNTQLKDVFKNAIGKDIESNNIIEKIEHAFLEDYWKMTKAKDDINDHFIKTFQAVAQMYGLKFDTWLHADIKDIKSATTKLLKNLEEKITTGTAPKQRLLTFSVNDEDGHHDVYTVTSKDIKFVDGALSARVYESDEGNLLENILENDSIISQKLLELSGKSEKDIWRSDIDVSAIIRQIYLEFIKDESISVTQFSEFLKVIIATGRHEGDAKWVTV